LLDPEATDQAALAKLGEVNVLQVESSQKRLLHQRDIQKRFPELGLGKGRGRGGRGLGGGYCAGRDRDRGYCR